MDTPSRDRRWLIALVAAGTIARLLPLLLPVHFPWVGPDSVTYLEPAHGMASGLGYVDGSGAPTAYRPPGYPAFLALIFALSDHSEAAVRLVQALLGGLVAAAIYRLTHSLTGKPTWALIGGWLAALDPISIGQSPFLLREALLLFLLVGLNLAWVELRGRPRAVVAGLLLAALALTHQLYAVLGGFLFLAEVCARGPRALWGRRLLPWVGMGLIVVLAAFLWVRRTERLTGHLSFTASENAVPAREFWLTSACPNLWLNGDRATDFQRWAFAEERELVREHGVAKTKEIYWQRCAENWSEAPGRSFVRLARMNAWYWLEIPGAIRLAEHPRLFVVRWALLPFHWVRLTCALAGLLFLLRSGGWRRYRIAIACLAFLALAPALLYPVPRYLGPGAPLLDYQAAVGLGHALEKRRERREQRESA